MSKKLIQITSSIASGVGVVISIILTTLSISSGYNTVRCENLNEYTVKLFGISIYTITKEGESFNGNGNFFLIILIGVVLSMILTGLSILVELLIIKIKDKKRSNNGY